MSALIEHSTDDYYDEHEGGEASFLSTRVTYLDYTTFSNPTPLQILPTHFGNYKREDEEEE